MQRTDKNKLPPDLFARNTVIAHIAQIVATEAPLKVLDVGGYGGKLSWFFPEETKFVILDKNPKPENEETDYQQGDAQKIPYSDNNFDVVISTDMLEHIEKPFRAPAIRELLRVSKGYVLIGVPCKASLTEKAEKYINDHFKKNTGNDHPFLIEHMEYGLPEEEKMDEILTKENLEYCKVKEGNLMNWYIQQLYAGIEGEQKKDDKQLEYYKFYNDNLFDLGNLRPPVYRTIFCIAKSGKIPEQAINEELQSIHKWNPMKFMELLEMAFSDLKSLIKQRNTKLTELTNIQNHKIHEVIRLKKEYEESDARHEHTLSQLHEREKEVMAMGETIARARKSIETYRAAINEVRAFLSEKEKTINMLKKLLEDKSASLDSYKELSSGLKNDLENIKQKANKLSAENGFIMDENLRLREFINKNERLIIENRQELNNKNMQLQEVNQDLANHRDELNKVRNSRAWKAIMVYSRIKHALILSPIKNVKKGWRILTTLGPKELVKRAGKKILTARKSEMEESFTQRVLTPYEKYIELTGPTNKVAKNAKREIEKFLYQPMISILMPVYNVEQKWLEKAIETVRAQWYKKWELCICNDASTDSRIKSFLDEYQKNDPRIKVLHRPTNGGIVKATNDALRTATGAYTAFMDNDDELAPNALFEIVKNLQDTKYDFIYSDEDKINEDGKREEPFFKPDWSLDQLFSHNYISHLAVYKRKIIEQIGGLREGFEGSQDYDLNLRFTEKTQSIKHIPKILYHWRKISGSTAAEVDAKPYAFDAAKKALEQALKRRNINGAVSDGLWMGSYKVQRSLNKNPLVSIIIPFKDKADILKVCLDSIIGKSTYQNYEIILINNNSELLETREYLETQIGEGKIKIYAYDEPFNYSAINNFAVKKAKGEVLLLLNNDTEVISPGWIEAMLEHALRPEVGAVGAKLLFPNDKIQHAGVIIGLSGLANHAFQRENGDDHCYFGQANIVKNYSAVTGACFMIRKDIYRQMGGLNEDALAVSFNDVDLCLRLRERGYLIVYTPYAALYHHESLSRGYEVSFSEIEYLRRTHRAILKNGDPYYNPNLTLEKFDFSLRVSDKTF